MTIAKRWVGAAAFPFRATLFHKSRSKNWLVSWHQDTALPVLAQQFLQLTVNLSDRFLAGNFQAATPEEQPAYQAAQTTANYLAWFISSYVVLVSVGSTALVARFTGAGDQVGRTHAEPPGPAGDSQRRRLGQIAVRSRRRVA